MVPRGRLELPRHSALPPQDSVSTNSTTWAQLSLYSKAHALASVFFTPSLFSFQRRLAKEVEAALFRPQPPSFGPSATASPHVGTPGARPDKNDCSLPSQQQARRPCPALQMRFPIPPTALPDDSDKTQQRPPMPPDLDRFPASVYTVFRFMSSGNRTAVAPPTPPGPKGSNGNGCCRVSGSQKGATRLRPFSLTPPWLRHDIRLSAGAFFA